MSLFRTAALLAFFLALAAAPVAARDYDKRAGRAQQQALAAITVFVDSDWGGREDGAAQELTDAHAAFARHGYDVVDVVAYTENGDLEGFFVTYRRR